MFLKGAPIRRMAVIGGRGRGKGEGGVGSAYMYIYTRITCPFAFPVMSRAGRKLNLA